jgi:hypothetical protein
VGAANCPDGVLVDAPPYESFCILFSLYFSFFSFVVAIKQCIVVVVVNKRVLNLLMERF